MAKTILFNTVSKKERETIFAAVDELGVNVSKTTRSHSSLESHNNLSIGDYGEIAGNCTGVGNTMYDWAYSVSEFIEVLEKHAKRKCVSTFIPSQTNDDELLIL